MDNVTRALLKDARDILGVLHVVQEGPNAGWVGGIDGYYDDDLVPDPDCPVCAVERRLDAALNDIEQT